MQIIIYNKYIPFTVFHPRILRQHDCSGLFTFLYTFIPFLYTRAYESFCRMQAGYCDRFECESIIFNMPGRDRVPLGGGWWTNSVGGLTRDDECIIPKNVYRLPSYRPSRPFRPFPLASGSSRKCTSFHTLRGNANNKKACAHKLHEPDNSDPIVLMQIRDTGCCNFKLFTRKRNDTRTTTVGMLITKADAGRLSTTLHGTQTRDRK